MEYKKYILIFCFVILASIARSGTPVASYEFSSPTVSNNISFVFSSTSTAEAYTVPTTKADSACRHIPPSKYGYFNVNDATIPSTQNNLIVNITFFDESSTKINLQYNANDGK